jgi:hypothetical protein
MDVEKAGSSEMFYLFLFYHEDGDSRFLRNVRIYSSTLMMDVAGPPKRWYLSVYYLEDEGTSEMSVS